jgi:hypothetical protein
MAAVNIVAVGAAAANLASLPIPTLSPTHPDCVFLSSLIESAIYCNYREMVTAIIKVTVVAFLVGMFLSTSCQL